jgi:hypothetical protein
MVPCGLASEQLATDWLYPARVLFRDLKQKTTIEVRKVTDTMQHQSRRIPFGAQSRGRRKAAVKSPRWPDAASRLPIWHRTACHARCALLDHRGCQRVYRCEAFTASHETNEIQRAPSLLLAIEKSVDEDWPPPSPTATRRIDFRKRWSLCDGLRRMRPSRRIRGRPGFDVGSKAAQGMPRRQVLVNPLANL